MHRLRGLPSPPLHPLVSLIDYGKTKILPEHLGERWNLGFYSIGVKRNVGTLRYGQQQYDFDEGLMSFIAPGGQLLRIEPNSRKNVTPEGWLLLIHPDYLWNTSLTKRIKQYEFFQYAINEALFMSPSEEKIIEGGIFQNIQQEIASNIDSFSQNIIIAQIELLLQYAERFYQRQFITRKKGNHQLLVQLEDYLLQAFSDEELIKNGVPSVIKVSEHLNLSPPSYLSSLLKSNTGLNTQQFIQEKLLEKAKERLSASELSISEIAFSCGFEHSQSFSKFFKSKTRLTPTEFRDSFN